MSNLLAAGHAEVNDYPVWMIWYQNQLVVERQNALITTNAIVLQAAMHTAAMNSKDGARQAAERFKELIEGLSR